MTDDAQWCYVIVNDITPNRGTIVAVYRKGDEANAHMERVGGVGHAMLVRWATTEWAEQNLAVGQRIWL